MRIPFLKHSEFRLRSQECHRFLKFRHLGRFKLSLGFKSFQIMVGFVVGLKIDDLLVYFVLNDVQIFCFE